jgi:hypothetical protein
MADVLFTTIPLDPGGRAHAFWRRPARPRPAPDAPPAPPGVPFLDAAPELVGAPRGGCARFGHVALAAWLGRREGRLPCEEREAVRDAFPRLLDAFERREGRLRRWYFGRNVLASAALTEQDHLAVTIGPRVPPGSEALVELVRRCQQIGYTAWHRLAPYDRRLCEDMVFSIVEEALRRLDGEEGVADAEACDQCIGRLGSRLDEAEEFMLRCASRRAQSQYLKGMLLGMLVTGLAIGAVALAVVLRRGAEIPDTGVQLLLVATAGAVGAAVSVPMRMTTGSFRMNLPTLNAEMKGTDVRLVASLRPVIGLVLALASYAMVVGGLAPVDADRSPTAIYVAVAFLAGFTERFAQDMFVRSGRGLEGVMGDSPSSGPSAGISPPPGAQPDAASAHGTP